MNCGHIVLFDTKHTSPHASVTQGQAESGLHLVLLCLTAAARKRNHTNSIHRSGCSDICFYQKPTKQHFRLKNSLELEQKATERRRVTKSEVK